jgi:predicted transcriptional regulator
MAKQSVSFLIDSEKVSTLDSLAKNQDRDRSCLLNEAVDNYLDLQKYHLELIQKGLDAIEAGDVISHEEVMRRSAERRLKTKAHAG